MSGRVGRVRCFMVGHRWGWQGRWGSVAANLVIDAGRQYRVGLYVNANYIRSVTVGGCVCGG